MSFSAIDFIAGDIHPESRYYKFFMNIFPGSKDGWWVIIARYRFIAGEYVSYAGMSSLGRYVFGSEISYNKAPPRLPGLAC